MQSIGFEQGLEKFREVEEAAQGWDQTINENFDERKDEQAFGAKGWSKANPDQL